MKTIIKFSIALIFLFNCLVSCKKNDNVTSTATVPIQVQETTTGSPVAGASVSLRRCAALGCVWGLVEEFSGVTDNNGICHVPKDKYDKVPFWNEAISVIKPGYWGEIFAKTTSVTIAPVGWMRLHIIRSANYPSGSLLKINVWRQTLPLYIANQEFNIAADSSVLINAFGNQLNKIDWQVASVGTGSVLNS